MCEPIYMQKVARDLCKFVLETWPVCGNPLETCPMQNLARDLPGAGDLLRSYTSALEVHYTFPALTEPQMCVTTTET